MKQTCKHTSRFYVWGSSDIDYVMQSSYAINNYELWKSIAITRDSDYNNGSQSQ